MISVKHKLESLRNAMSMNGIAAYIVPGTDPHAGEYIADHWKEREWISGFDGSVGTAAITHSKAGMWIDSRYFLQADEQLAGTGFDSMKIGLAETPEIIPWLISQLKKGEKVGVNPQMFSVNTYNAMKNELSVKGLELVSVDLVADIWLDRPDIPRETCFVYPVEHAGKSCREKLLLLRKELQKLGADVFVISALDDIAWLFNLRGRDVDYNPVVIAYALVSLDSAVLYLSGEKLNDDTRSYLENEHVSVRDYLQIYDDLKRIPLSQKIFIDGAKLNQSLYEAIPFDSEKINQMSPVFRLKSVKNEVELAGLRSAMVRDGVALIRFFMWFEKHVDSGKLTEVSIAEKLYHFRAEQDNFFGESFGTIAGYAAHGAIVHYKADEKSDVVIKTDNLLLLDSGAQYLDGTTDITRTIALGVPTQKQKIDFTLVLKGHIGIATAVFPFGTRGSQLDILARKAMWDRYMNYGHGTGHGVGLFLNVHEGPQNIRMDENPTVLQPGMLLSNEPGLYRTGEYGIRTENLIHVVEAEKSDFGQFLKFETLTFFPIDLSLIDKKMMTENEIDWLNAYHQQVFDKLSPYLTEEESKWLKNKTKFI
ncbi:MAG: aminopeptidase P family protein [Paludibacter sp.]|nr:aminopeptidase P family protein [Paludibacter sp.]